MTDDDFILAAELALGLLDPIEGDDAERRYAADPPFAAAVDRWRSDMLADVGEVPPPASAWPAIQRRLADNDNAASGATLMKRWRAAALAAGSIAAVLALMLVTRPPETVERVVERIVEVPVARPPVMAAALSGEGGADAVAISIEAGGSMILVTPVTLAEVGGDPELWVIPADGRPRSLGLVSADAPGQMTVSNDLRVLLRDGATLAISIEPAGGSPTGQPTGPIAATGEIRPI